MVAKSKHVEEERAVEILKLNTAFLSFYIVGTSPMIMHRFSTKARHELLFPEAKSRINQASREASLKHDPIKEFREALYLSRDPSAPAMIHIPTPTFHRSLAEAAIDMPGAAKTKMLRWTSIIDSNIDLFGLPLVHMDMVRSSDMKRTPDVRTRPIFREWACKFTVRLFPDFITKDSVANLLTAAGELMGVGDWRPQKGGNFGRYRVAEPDDAQYHRIVETCGRAAQKDAYDHPSYYDEDSAELASWFFDEIERREKKATGSENRPARSARKPKIPELARIAAE